MRKQRVVTNYQSLRQDVLLTVAVSSHDALNGNADFPTPPITISAYDLLNKAYATALADAHKGTPDQTAAKNVAKKEVLEAMSKLAVYVNTVAVGDEVKLRGSGFTIAKTPQPKGPLAIPASFKVMASPEPGRAVVEFAGLANANYMVRLTTNNATDRNLWPTAIDTRRSFNVDGLTSGSRYTFIGAYKGASNVLNFSAPVEVVIQ